MRLYLTAIEKDNTAEEISRFLNRPISSIPSDTMQELIKIWHSDDGPIRVHNAGYNLPNSETTTEVGI